MKKVVSLFVALVPVLLSSCASNPPAQVFHNEDKSALIVQSLDAGTCQVIAPTTMPREEEGALLGQGRDFPHHETALVILENYKEPQLGDEFRDRSVRLFVVLRTLGYEHIVFLKGNGLAQVNGLPMLAEYD